MSGFMEDQLLLSDWGKLSRGARFDTLRTGLCPSQKRFGFSIFADKMAAGFIKYFMTYTEIFGCRFSKKHFITQVAF